MLSSYKNVDCNTISPSLGFSPALPVIITTCDSINRWKKFNSYARNETLGTEDALWSSIVWNQICTKIYCNYVLEIHCPPHSSILKEIFKTVSCNKINLKLVNNICSHRFHPDYLDCKRPNWKNIFNLLACHVIK